MLGVFRWTNAGATQRQARILGALFTGAGGDDLQHHIDAGRLGVGRARSGQHQIGVLGQVTGALVDVLRRRAAAARSRAAPK
jgi:hypothetical protein